MDISNYITPLAGLVGIMVSITTLLITFQKLKSIRGEQAKELHSKYSASKGLASDLDNNYPEILILLNGITRAELTKGEIEWFLNEPGAFLKLEHYGRINGRYCTVDLDLNEFSLTEIVSTRKKRMIEKLRIVSVGFGLLAFLSLVWGVIIYQVNDAATVYLALTFWLIYFVVILWGTNMLWGTINKAVNLQGKPLKNS